MDIDSNTSARTLTPDPVTSPIAYLTSEPQQLIKLNDKLSALGIDQKDSSIQLPRITLIGDQSSGKSCLTFMLTGISTPRDQGTCTRVPFHINTSKSEGPWKCGIYLDTAWSFHAVAANRDPWSPTAATTTHFTDCHDVAQLEDLLRRAQAALLHPTERPDKFLRGHVVHEKGVGFSPNIVRLQVESSDVSDLSVYDLPGLFVQASDPKEQHLPKRVLKLVSEYVKSPNNIILLVMALNHDPETSQAAKIVRDLKATDRTIGVLTKPDTLESGSFSSYTAVRSLLEGGIFQLEYGYCVAKLPSQRELEKSISREEALDNEDRFFASSHSAWVTHLAAYSDRFGTVKIQRIVSDLLVRRIKLYLPDILDKIRVQLDEVSSRLDVLPKPTDAATAMAIVDRTLSRIEGSLHSLLVGDYPHTQLIIKWKEEVVNKLSKDFTATKPAFKKSQPLTTTVHRGIEAINLCDDDDDDSLFLPSTPSSKKRGATTLTKSTPSPKKQKTTSNHIKREPSYTATEESQGTHTYTLEQLEQVAKRVDATGVYGATDSRAVREIVQPVVNKWNALISHFLTTSSNLAQEHVDQMLQAHLRELHGTPLSAELLSQAKALLTTVLHEAMANITSTLHAEQENSHIVFDDTEFARVEAEELHLILSKLTSTASAKAVSNCKQARQSPDSDVVNPPGRQVQLLAAANACISVAMDHLVHHCGKQVQSAFRKVANPEVGLIATLKKKWVMEGGSAKCQALLEQNAAQAQERTELEKIKANLKEAEALVREFSVVD